MTLSQAPRAVVVDASAAIPFLQGDAGWRERWEGWINAGDFILAPPHFPIEVANGLLRGSSIASPDHIIELVRELYATGVEVADRGLRGIEGAIRLASQHGLTAYDAAYLDLAIDVDGELATDDRELRTAAKSEGVSLIG